MTNPFDPLITVSEFKTKVGDTSTSDDQAIAFLKRSYQMFLSFDLPISLNGEPRTIVEESMLSQLGGSKSEWNFVGKPAKLYIHICSPILNLVSVKMKNQTGDEPLFSPDLPIYGFIYMANSYFIESTHINFNDYVDLYWPLSNSTKYIQVTYTSGIEVSAKADILEALELIHLDLGYNTAQEEKLNEPRRTRVLSDDTAWHYDWSSVKTTENYIRNKPHLARLLNKYAGIKKLIF